jgi:hypothetical protein
MTCAAPFSRCRQGLVLPRALLARKAVSYPPHSSNGSQGSQSATARFRTCLSQLLPDDLSSATFVSGDSGAWQCLHRFQCCYHGAWCLTQHDHRLGRDTRTRESRSSVTSSSLAARLFLSSATGISHGTGRWILAAFRSRPDDLEFGYVIPFFVHCRHCSGDEPTANDVWSATDSCSFRTPCLAKSRLGKLPAATGISAGALHNGRDYW